MQARLRHRFSPRRVLLTNSGCHVLSEGGSDSSLYLISRSLCLFLKVDATNIPTKQRREFVALAVRRAAPFTDAEFDVAWSKSGVASVFYWSTSKAHALIGTIPGRRDRCAAESFYVSAPKTDETELLHLAEGVEGRVWEGGNLTASRWWPVQPSASQWMTFARGIGANKSQSQLPQEQALETLQRAPWNKSPHGVRALDLAALDKNLPKAAAAVAIALLLLTGWQIGGIARAKIDVARATSAANSLDAPLRRILDARAASDLHAQQIQDLLALRGPARTSSLMASFAESIPGSDWQVRQWNQPTPDTLEVVMLAPSINPEALLKALESSKALSNITSDIDSNGEVKIRATVLSILDNRTTQ